MHLIHSMYMYVDDDTTRGATAERKLIACVLFVSSFGNSQSVEKFTSDYHHTHVLPALPSAKQRQVLSFTVQKKRCGLACRVLTDVSVSCLLRSPLQSIPFCVFFGQDVPLRATEHVIENKKMTLSQLPLSHIHVRARTATPRCRRSGYNRKNTVRCAATTDSTVVVQIRVRAMYRSRDHADLLGIPSGTSYLRRRYSCCSPRPHGEWHTF